MGEAESPQKESRGQKSLRNTRIVQSREKVVPNVVAVIVVVLLSVVQCAIDNSVTRYVVASEKI